jgi:hypothetical protein
VILERLWSLAHQILIDTPRKKMMPATVCTWVTCLLESWWPVLGPRPCF